MRLDDFNVSSIKTAIFMNGMRFYTLQAEVSLLHGS